MIPVVTDNLDSTPSIWFSECIELGARYRRQPNHLHIDIASFRAAAVSADAGSGDGVRTRNIRRVEVEADRSIRPRGSGSRTQRALRSWGNSLAMVMPAGGDIYIDLGTHRHSFLGLPGQGIDDFGDDSCRAGRLYLLSWVGLQREGVLLRHTACSGRIGYIRVVASAGVSSRL